MFHHLVPSIYFLGSFVGTKWEKVAEFRRCGALFESSRNSVIILVEQSPVTECHARIPPGCPPTRPWYHVNTTRILCPSFPMSWACVRVCFCRWQNQKWEFCPWVPWAGDVLLWTIDCFCLMRHILKYFLKDWYANYSQPMENYWANIWKFYTKRFLLLFFLILVSWTAIRK